MRQKGSHVRLRKITEAGEHNITVPRHNEKQRELLMISCLKYLYGTTSQKKN
ncbi:hypothetical protein ABOONEI_555 [Aciduliprofundum boonei T469]|nr:hypothetical protein ABOONEI_555 [Aciduliprofundum boonei T469]